LDYGAFYHLEEYLFSEVHTRFHRDRRLGAFDFFCIVVWKANRAKSKVAKKLLSRGHASLDAAVAELTGRIAAAPDAKARLRVLVVDWGFRMPVATAILAVLYPDAFTICDARVAQVVGTRVPEMYGNFDTLWQRYQEFQARVERSAPEGLSLRDKDRYLWGKSFRDGLVTDLRAWQAPLDGTAPDAFSARIGGFTGPNWEVVWRGGVLRYRRHWGNLDDGEVHEVCPTPEAWRRFWQGCDEIGVWRWDARYDNLLVLDGIQWELEMRVGARAVRSSGSNAYPHPVPGADPMERTPAFRRFLALVRELLDGLEFG